MDWEGVVHHSGDNPIKHFCKVFSLPFAPDTKPFSVVENVFPFNKSLKVSLKKAISGTSVELVCVVMEYPSLVRFVCIDHPSP